MPFHVRSLVKWRSIHLAPNKGAATASSAEAGQGGAGGGEETVRGKGGESKPRGACARVRWDGEHGRHTQSIGGNVDGDAQVVAREGDLADPVAVLLVQAAARGGGR